MPLILEAELKKQISSGCFSNLYFLYGEEKYLVKHYTNLLLKKIVNPDFADFNLHSYDGKSVDLDDVAAACEALPMMSEYSCIYIKDFQVDNLNSDNAEKLIKLISDIPETTIIIISALNVDLNMKSQKGKKILTELEKHGTCVQFVYHSMSQLIKLIQKGALTRNCTIENSEASYLVSLIGSDMTVIINELDKICAYIKSGRVQKADIDAVAVKSMQAKAFDLTKQIIAGNCDGAMMILDTLIAMKEEPISILGAVMTPYIDMYRAKVYLSGGKMAEDAAKDFNYKNKEFRLTNGARSASKYSISQLRQFLDVLNDADTMIKTTSINGRLVLEQTITKLLLVSNGEKI